MTSTKVRTISPEYKWKYLRDSNGTITSDHGDTTWTIGKWNSVLGEVKLCSNGFHCSDKMSQAFSYVQGDVLAKVEVKGASATDTDKSCHRSMRLVEAYRWTKKDSVALSIFAAELVVANYEQWNPNDTSLREAIKAARQVLAEDTEANRAAAWSAWSAAWSAAESAWSAAESAAWSAAESAAESAWSAAESAAWSAAESAAESAWSAAESAAESAAWSAAESARSAALDQIEDWLAQHVPELERI